MTTAELLALHSDLSQELRDRKITRSSNNPVGDYAESLFARAFGWKLASNSISSFDAVDADGVRYQIKGRRVTRHNNSTQLGALRNLPDRGFDVLAAVIFAEDYTVKRALLLPHAAIEAQTRFSPHVKAWLLRLVDAHWELPGAKDVTDQVRQAQKDL